MPEGDSLHRAARQLTPILVGKEVRALALPRRVERTDGLLGQTVESVEARGKNLLVHFAGGMSLHVHLKMWGRIFITELSQARGNHSADTVVVLDTDKHRVQVASAPVARLIRKADLLRDLHFRGLGPDLLGPSFDFDEALTRLMRHKGVPLGEALLDQSAVAGIGNVWKSELCFNLRLDPFAHVSAFTDDELSALLRLAREQMQENVARKPRTIPDPFTPPSFSRKTRVHHRQGQKPVSVYGREGAPCYDCGTNIQMRRQGELLRSTYFCPRCQPHRSAA